MSAATAGPTRRRGLAALALVGLAALGILAAVLGLGGSGAGERARAGGAPGPLVWAAPPRAIPAPGMPRDRILTGRVRNKTDGLALVEARNVRVLDRDGRRLDGAGIFLGSFVRGIYAAPRKAQASDFERRRTGQVLRLGPGQTLPLTVSWRLGRDGRPAARIDYGRGSLPVR